MAHGYPDYQAHNYIVEQSASLYFADVFRAMSVSPNMTDRRLVAEGKTWYVWESVKVSDQGALMVMGTVNIMGD